MNIPSLLHRLRPVLAALAAAALLPLAKGAPESASLLPDGSLERANATGEWPVGWSRAKNVSWESEPGNFFFRLTAPQPGTHVSLYHKITLPANVTQLELSFRTRLSDFVVGDQPWYDARVIMNFRDATGKVTTAKPTPRFTRNIEGWQISVHQIAVPPGSVTLEFLPSLFRATSGSFDLDDIVLKPVATAP